MGNILQKAIADWRRFSQSAFDLELFLTSPDGSQTATVKGIGTRAMIPVETDGQEAIGELVHIGFSEPLLAETNPDYPIRNSDGLVAMNNHRVNFNDSNGNLRTYIIKVVYPDNTVGMIMCDCADYKVVSEPTPPTNLVISDIQSTQFTATVTPPSNGQQTGYQWKISTDGGLSYVVAGTTDGDTPTFDYTGLLGSTEYYAKALATGDVDSDFSNVGITTTLQQYIPEAEAYFLRNPTLSDFEKDVINTLIVSEKAAGHYQTRDEYFILGLTSGNPLIGLKYKMATAFNGTTHSSIGYTFNGINSYLALGYTPNIDGANFKLNDAAIYGFLKEFVSGGVTSIWGVIEGGSPRTNISNTVDNTQIVAGINSNQALFNHSYSNNSTYISSRINSNQSTLSKNLNPITLGTITSYLSSKEIFLGALNNDGVSASNYLNGAVSAFSIGDSTNLDESVHDENMRIAIASLIDGTLVPDLTAANIIIDAA